LAFKLREIDFELVLRRPIETTSIKGKVKKNTSPTTGFFLGFQPLSLSRMCSRLPFLELGTLQTLA